MARLNTYPNSDYINSDDAFVIDGPHGTRKVSISTVMNYIPSFYITENELNSTIGSDKNIDPINFSSYFLKENIIPTIVSPASNTTILSKKVSELQSGITVSEFKITGTLRHITGFTSFGGSSEDQSGNYLVLDVKTEDGISGISLKYSYSNYQNKEVKVVDNHYIIVRVEEKDGSKGLLTISATKGTDNYSVWYDLNNLVLEKG